MKKTIIFFIFLLSGIAGFLISLYTHRNSSVDDVQTIETFHYPATFVNQLKNDPRTGEKIFKEFCATCHDKNAAIDVNAPKIGDSRAWRALKKAGINNLLKITAQGAGAMPARGGCFECTDDQLLESIRYILQNSN